MWVVGYHLLLPAGFVGGLAARLLGRGYLAVDLFFVLSGFVLARNDGARFAGVPRLAHAAGFLGRRLARIYPLYALILAVRLAYTVLRYGGFALPRPWIAAPVAHPWLAIPANFLLVQSWGVAPSITGPAWSVSTEWAAYLVFPALAAVMLHAGRARAVAVAAAGAALVLVASRHGQLDAWDGRTAGPLLRCLGGFTLGVAAWRVAAWAQAAGRAAAWGAASAGLCVALAAGLALGAPDVALYPLLPALILALSCGGTASGPGRLLSAPALVWLGERSYALYLLHIFLLHPLDATRAACRLVLPAAAADALAACLVLALLTAAAALAYRLVEQPARAWLNAWVARRGALRSSLTHPGPALRNLPLPAPRAAFHAPDNETLRNAR